MLSLTSQKVKHQVASSKHNFAGHAWFSKRSDVQLVDFHDFLHTIYPLLLKHGWEMPYQWRNLPKNSHPHPVPRVVLGVVLGGCQASQKWKIFNTAAVLGALADGLGADLGWQASLYRDVHPATPRI